MWRRRRFHGINAMILMPQIFDVTANENARYKRSELEYWFIRSMTPVIQLVHPYINQITSQLNCNKWWRHGILRRRTRAKSRVQNEQHGLCDATRAINAVNRLVSPQSRSKISTIRIICKSSSAFSNSYQPKCSLNLLFAALWSIFLIGIVFFLWEVWCLVTGVDLYKFK